MKLNALLSQSEGKNIDLSFFIKPFGGFLDVEVFLTIDNKNYVGHYQPSGTNIFFDYMSQVNLEEVQGERSTDNSADSTGSSHSL